MRKYVIAFCFFTSTLVFSQQNQWSIDSITAIKVSNNVTVNLHQSDKNIAAISDGKNIENFEKEFINGQLTLKYTGFDNDHNIVVDIFTPDIHKISAASMATVATFGAFSVDTLYIEARSGADLHLEASCSYLQAECNEGSFLELMGKAETIKLESKTKASIDAFKLRTNNIIARAKWGGIIKLQADGPVQALAGLNAYVGIKGNSAPLTIKQRLGGKVELLDK